MATQKPRPGLPWGIIIAVGALGFVLSRVPGAAPWVLGLCALVVVAALILDNSRAVRKRSKGPKTFRSGIYYPNAKIDGLSVLGRLTYLVEPDGTEVLRATATNRGTKLLGPLHMELSLTYTSFFGNPGRGGNHWDGLLLDPPPPIERIDPGETVTVDVFRSDAEPAIIDESDHDKKLAVRAKVEAAPSILEFIRIEPTGAFDITLRVGSPAHGAAWRPDRPDLER